jgi:hypothetical protein
MVTAARGEEEARLWEESTAAREAERDPVL